MNVVGSKDDYSRWKPDGFKKHKTIQEVATLVHRSTDRIKQLEKLGRLPRPIRVKVGRLQVRLYSPSEVKAIKTHFKNAKPGNPNQRRKA